MVDVKLPNLSVSALWRELRLKVTQPLLWQALARQYAKQSLPWQGGYTARQAVRLDASLTAAVQALGGCSGKTFLRCHCCAAW